MAETNIPISNGRKTKVTISIKCWCCYNTIISTANTHWICVSTRIAHTTKLLKDYIEMNIWFPAGVALVIQGYKVGESVECNEPLLVVYANFGAIPN